MACEVIAVLHVRFVWKDKLAKYKLRSALSVSIY